MIQCPFISDSMFQFNLTLVPSNSVLNSNNAIDSLCSSKYRCWFMTESRFLNVFSVNGQDLQNRFIRLYYVSIVPQPDIDAVFLNNYSIQIIETGFTEQVKSSCRMGLHRFDENFRENSFSETYQMVPPSTHLFSHMWIYL